MKKWMLILLALLLVAAAVGCGKSTAPAPGIITPGAMLGDAADNGGEDAHEVHPAPLPEENSGNSHEQITADEETAKPSADKDTAEPPKTEDTPAKDDNDSGKEEGGKKPANSGNVIAGGLWDGGPVTWEITSDGVLTIAGNRSVQAKQKYIWWDYGDTVTKVVIADGITNVPENAFRGMASLREVSLGNAVKTIEEGAFANCPALTTVTIPASVTTIELYAFSHCTALQTISFTAGGAGLTIGQYAFAGAGLTTFTAPSQLRTIESHAFTKCDQLQTIRLEGGVSTVKARAFESCPALQHVVIGQSVSDCGGYIFNGCSAITTVENYSPCLFDEFIHLPNLTTVVVGGSRNATGRFYGCPKLRSVTIGGNIGKISDLAFENCPALTSITIPNTVTTIGDSAFHGTGLTSVLIPNTVTTIGDSAFRGTGLTSVLIPASVTALGDFVFASTSLQEVTFTGNAPAMNAASTFGERIVTAYYPASNPTWTEEVLENYGGSIIWTAQ